MNIKSLFNLFSQSSNSFQGQVQGEQVILFLRRHPFVILVRLLGILLAYLIPIIIGIVFIDFISKNNLIPLGLFLLSLWTVLVWFVTFYALTMYTLDVWIVTNTRIIDSTQHGFFSRTVSELHLSRIQDIYIKTDGPFQTFINFGDLFIQTAGTEERFMFYQIPKPLEVKDAIMKLAFPEGK